MKLRWARLWLQSEAAQGARVSHIRDVCILTPNAKSTGQNRDEVTVNSPQIMFILASLRCGGRIGPGGWREQLEVGAASVCSGHSPVAI